MNSSEFKPILFLALTRAGKLIRDRFDHPRTISFKGSPINLVTEVDQAADRLIRRTIHARFPDHDFLTEESIPTGKGSPFKWIVDPLDGTTNYAHHYPQVGVSIALEYTPPHPQPLSLRARGAASLTLSRRERVADATATLASARAAVAEGRVRQGTIILGGVYDPFRDELFWAVRGKGAFLRRGTSDKKIHVSQTRRLASSLLLTGFPYDRRERVDIYLSYVREFMQRIQGIRREGAAALDLCWVACGRVDGYWEWRLKPWDVAAGKIIVEEAGGRLTTFAGKPFSIYGEQTLATNRRIHREMLAVMEPLEK
jgi:myo-inositol-1(or 4)-monophosphatase